jgi:hypothetical protein
LLKIVTYSYLLLPLCFILIKGKFKHRILALLVLYGIVFFGLLFIYDYLPQNFLNNYFQGLYTLLEYSFFAYFFWFTIQSKGFRKIIIIISILFGLYQFFYITSVNFIRLDSISIGIETILVFIYIFYFFYEFSKNTKDVFIYNHYGFWLAVGIMIYLGGSFFFYILINSLTDNEIDKFSNMTYVAEIIKNLLFAFSIFIYKKHPVNKPQNHSKNIPNLDMNLI